MPETPEPRQRGLFETPPPGAERVRRGARRRDEARPPRAEPAAEPAAFTVTQLTREVAARLSELGRVRVEGEVSELRRPASGHLYFNLKDPGARLACVVWRSQVGRIKVEPKEGDRVIVHGRIDVYAPRGSYSLVVERIEPLGIGALLAQLEELKRELRQKGWFDRARPLPALPEMIGVVTSRDGAALRDFLRTRSLRWPGYPVRLAHTPVQGAGASVDVARAISALDRSGVDVIVVCRGGGSIEDLWAFNERTVAAAIWDARVPVVSGVGHESDTTLADLVADVRAHTPTNAAETVLPDRGELVGRLRRHWDWLLRGMEGVLETRGDRLGGLAGRRVVRDASWILADRERALRDVGARGRRAVRARAGAAETRLQRLLARLQQRSPRAAVERWSHRLASAGTKLERRAERRVDVAEKRLALAARSLEATSPLAVLSRGYSLTRKRGEPTPLTDADKVAAGDELESRLAKGTVRSKVTGVERDE